jgi:hypothetical protein
MENRIKPSRTSGEKVQGANAIEKRLKEYDDAQDDNHEFHCVLLYEWIMGFFLCPCAFWQGRVTAALLPG